MTRQSTPSITAAPPLGSAGGRPPRAQTQLWRGARPLKRWRYVAVFCDELMACAALVQIGPARQSFWAFLDRRDGSVRERTHMRPRVGELTVGPGELGIEDRGVRLALALDERPGVEALCPHGRHEVWTRKQAGVRARGTLALDGGPERRIDALAVIDDTAGHHARATEWRWSAGVGAATDGTPLAWNLVSGVNDPPEGSERAVWVDGEPHEPGPVTFAEDLSSIRGADGSELRFAAEAERSRRDNLLLVRSYYRAPFGTFSGTLPGGIELARGMGVMEHHRARW